MRIAICEDLEKDVRLLAGLLGKYKAENRLDMDIRLFSSAEALLTAFEPGSFQIIFFDIYLGELTGIDAARRIRELDGECAIIFVTTSESHAVDGFALRATHYLVKPVEYESLCEALERCRKQISRFAQYIEVLENRESVRVKMRDISYAEVFKNFCIIHTQLRDVKTYMTIDALEEMLGGTPFLRCHRSYIVNLHHVTAMPEGAFCIKDGEVRIGKTYGAKAKKAYRDFCMLMADSTGTF